MINFLAGFFIKNSKDYDNAEVRGSYGVLCGAVGVVLNVLLCAAKMVAGTLSGSVAIVADAMNNLSDAGSSVITMIGFKMAGKKPNPEHPFGHGRIEYITGLIVSFLIILMGFELGESSIEKILAPTPVESSSITVGILIVSVIVKLYMYAYNKKISNQIKSQAMMATAMDSFTDSVATSVVLFCIMLGEYTNLHIDGWCGLLVALFILYSGINSAKDTISPLLGCKPDEEFVKKIEEYAVTFPEVMGIHDLVVHDYGPGRIMISFHAEVPSNGDILKLHDVIDNIEEKLREALGCEAVIHMDPIVVDDEVTTSMKRMVDLLVKGVDECLTIHDFRMVEGPTHTNLIFDVVVPFGFVLSDEEVAEVIKQRVRELPGNHYAVVKIDKPYV